MSSEKPANQTQQSSQAEKAGQELERISGEKDLPASVSSLEFGDQGLQLKTLNDGYRFAAMVHQAQMAPKSLDTPAKILIAMQMGFELGLTPMAAIQNIAVINGRPSLWGDAVLGVIRAKGIFDEAAFKEWWELDEKGFPIKAFCTVRRLPNGNPITGEFSWEDAVRAGLTTKQGDTYKHYPKRMLQMRARGFAVRDAFADVLRGLPLAEEAADDHRAEKNITPSKPQNLDELTDRLEHPNVVETAPATESTAPATDNGGPKAVETVLDDPYAAIKEQLLECRTVPDVTRVKNALIGANSQYTPQEKADISAICEARACVIRDARRAGSQPSLPQS